jgi:hypothetical protein
LRRRYMLCCHGCQLAWASFSGWLGAATQHGLSVSFVLHGAMV